MKTHLIIAGLILALTGPAAHAAETIAVGVGNSAATSLDNAKEVAIGQIAGTFIVGKNTAEGDTYSSNIDEYVGGVIKHYEVLSVREDADGTYTTIIRADVDTDKVNSRQKFIGAQAPPNLADDTKKFTDDSNRAGRVLAALDDRRQAYAVQVENITTEIRGNYTDFYADVWITLQPKWVSDVEAMAKTIGREVHVDGGGSSWWGVWALVTPFAPILVSGAISAAARSEDDKNASIPTSSVPTMCIGRAGKEPDFCYETYHHFYYVQATIQLNGALVAADGSTVQLPPMRVVPEGMFGWVNEGQKVCFGGQTRKFKSPSMLIYKDGHTYVRYRFTVANHKLRNNQRLELAVM